MSETAPLKPLPTCPTCHSDMAGIPHSARFCPHCGTRLDRVRAAAESVATSAAAAAPALQRLRLSWNMLSGHRPPPDAPPVPLALRCSSLTDMVVGYANAMCKLGGRYESGAGAARNPDEATRCYFKAARLGNADAVARLESKNLAIPRPRPGTH